MNTANNSSTNPVHPSSGAGDAPSPVLFWETVNAHQRTAALRAGIDLGIFTAIAEGARGVEEISVRCQASPRGVRILCDYLTVIGFLQKEGGCYLLNRDADAFLNAHSPTYLGGMIRFINSPQALAGFANLTEVVRRGTTLLDGAGFVDPEDPVWVEFARSMPPLVASAAEFIGEQFAPQLPASARVLDLAAGHGFFGIHIARRRADVEIIAQDWAPVLEVARDNACEAGVPEARYRLLAGDAFQVTYPPACDLVLVTNLFHHFDLPACRRLAEKVHACLKPGGRMVTLEFVPNEDRISPSVPATFSLMMLGLTPSGDAYTFREFDELFQGAGFTRNELVPVPGAPQHLILSTREA